MVAFPFIGWAALYYAGLFMAYFFFFYRYFHDTLEQQLLGIRDTILLTALLVVYLLLVLIPAFQWGKKSPSRRLIRGIEAFICYTSINLILAVVFSAFTDGEWSVMSPVSVGGSVWTRMGSIAVLALMFLLAAGKGGKASLKGRRGSGSRKSRKGKARGASA